MATRVATTKPDLPKFFDFRSPIILVFFLALATLTTSYPLPLLLDYKLNFAPIFIWLIYLFFGLPWSLFGCICLGAAVALNAPDYGSQLGLWEHWIVTGSPHEIALLITELVAVSTIRRKRPETNLIVSVGGFWVFIGMPAHILVHGLSPFAPNIIPDSIDNVAMNMAVVEFVNALFNIVCAAIISSMLPSTWRVQAPKSKSEQRFADYLFNILALAVAFPAMIFIIHSAKPAREHLKQLTIDRMQADVKLIDLQMQIWFAKRVAEVERFAKVGSLMAETAKLRESANELTELFPEVRNLTILDRESREVLSYGSEPQVEQGQRSWSISQAHVSHKTLVKELDQNLDRQLPPNHEKPLAAADILIIVPILDEATQSRFLGVVLCELDASSIGNLITDVSNRSQPKISLFNGANQELTHAANSTIDRALLIEKVSAFQTQARQGPLMFAHYNAANRDHEIVTLLEANTPQKAASNSIQFIDSRYTEYVTFVSAPLPVPWTIVVTLSAAGTISQIEHGYIQTIEVLIVLIFLGLVAVKAGSLRVTRSLSELADLTSELSQRSTPLARSSFFSAPFSEIRVLQENFAALTNSLIARFAEVAQARSDLETRVDERTVLLRATNDSLAREIKVREQLTEDRDRIIGILQASADFVCMFKPDGEVLWLNDFAYRTLELSQNYLLSNLQIKNFLPVWAHNRLVEEGIPAAHNSNYWVGESAILDASGKTIPVSQMIIAHRELGGKVRYLSSVMRDMRQFKMIQDELEAARHDAELASRAKTLFMANMSHEIRTPVAVIRGFSELLADQAKFNPEQANWLSAILNSSKQLELLINDILDISKVERGVVQFEICKTSLSAIISEVQSSMQFAADQKHIDLRFVAQGYLPETIETDPHRIKQILFNLIGNAIKFTNSGAVEVIVSMHPSPWSQDQIQDSRSAAEQWLAFLVKDTGEGIEPEHQDKLFKPFVQADPSITRRYGGTGLGLFLSKQLAVNLGGDLLLRESTPGKGSSFEFILRHHDNLNSHLICEFSRPQLVSQVQTPRDSTSTPPPVDFSRNPQSTLISRTPRGKAQEKPLDGVSVLVVEDSPDLRLLIGQILKSQGAVCSFATNGAEGVESILVDQGAFDIVLMDIQMPVMDGYTAAAKLRESGFQRPVIALTAHALVGERERCIAAGFNDYLTKPVEVRLLIQMVLQWFQKQKEPDSIDSPERQPAAEHLAGANGMPGAKPESQTRA
jgi:signal transduction histidine kinase/CheY-like chemotaxis protein